MAHIHLVYPDVDTGYYPNLHHGIAFLVGALKENGHKISFDHITSHQEPEKVALRALNGEPDVIGLSLCHNQSYLAQSYVNSIRKIKKESFLIAGGIFPTTDPDDTFKRLDIDAIAMGEAEQNLVNLMNNISQDSGKMYSTSGFYFKMLNGSILKNEIPPLNPDLTKLSWPDYSVFDINKIVKDSGGWITMMLMRGCPYNCNYCCNSILLNLYPDRKNYFRKPPVEHAIKMILHNLQYAANATGISFDDDLLCQDEEWFLDFSRQYASCIGLPYTMNARVETLTEDVILSMKNSGCRIVNIGVESGNEWVRKNLLNRHYTNELLIKTFSNLRSAKILTSSYNMVGLPFETKSQMSDTLRLNKKLKPYRGACFYFFPYPQTKLFSICKQFNLFQKNYENFKGYFSAPGIKLTHCKLKDAQKICNKLRLFLYLNRILINMRLSWLNPFFYYCMIPFAGFLSRLLTGSSSIKTFIRYCVYRTIPSDKNKYKDD